MLASLPAVLHARSGGADSAPRADAAAAGEFAASLTRQQPYLARLVQRLMGWPGGASDVEDAVQEVLVSAWSKRAGFRGESCLRTWLTRIAIRHVRRVQRRRRLTLRLFQAWTGDVDAHLAGREVGDSAADDPGVAIRSGLRRLRPADREVLVLHYLEGMPLVAVAELLGLRENTVQARASRARRRLAVVLAGEAGDV